MDERRDRLAGKRLLIVEDEYMVASDLAYLLEGVGAEVLGPAGTVADGLQLIEERGGDLDGAVLDVNLRGERVYPVADALNARSVPFLFATGYDLDDLPERFADVPTCPKPVNRARLLAMLADVVG